MLRSAILTSAAHLSKILMGFVLVKLIAFYLGPAGLGELGHLMSLVTVVTMVSGGGITNAVVKYVSEYRDNLKARLIFIRESFSYSVVVSSIIFFSLVLFSSKLSLFLFKKEDYFWIIVVLAFVQYGMAIANLVSGVAIGMMLHEVYSKIQIIGSVITFPIVWLFVAFGGIAGASLGLIAVSSMTLLPAIYFYLKSPFFSRITFIKIRYQKLKDISSYTLMVIVSAISFPLVEFVVREILIQGSGYESAGVWQGSVKLASAYLGFFGVFLSYYFVPKISSVKSKLEIKKITLEMLCFVGAVFLFGSSILYFWRDFFIPLILSSKFSVLKDLILYQIIGDFFKVLSYVFAFVAVSKAAAKLYIIGELIQGTMFVAFVLLRGVAYVDVSNVLQAYVLTYFLYFIVCLISFFYYLRLQ